MKDVLWICVLKMGSGGISDFLFLNVCFMKILFSSEMLMLSL